MAEEIKITVRLPVGLHMQLEHVAQLDQRSMNGEIIVFIREALERRKIHVLSVSYEEAAEIEKRLDAES